MSAPVRPTVPPASRSRSTSSASGTSRHVDLEDRQAALVGRPIDGDVPIEAAGPQQGRIEHVGPVGGGQHDDRFVRAEAVHLAQDLVERLLALVVPAAEAGAADAADGVDLVDEQDAGGGFLGGLEHVADAAGADADEHLDELGAADRKERHARLAGHGPGQQRLAGARRAHQQHALGHAAAEALELLGVLQELDDFLQVVLHAFQAGDVVERDRLLAGFVALGGALAEAREDAAAHELIAGAAEHHPHAKNSRSVMAT